jgi:hypothetical protein
MAAYFKSGTLPRTPDAGWSPKYFRPVLLQYAVMLL